MGLLLDANVSALRKNTSEQCCYHLAAQRNNFEVLDALMGHGVKLKMTEAEGKNVLHILADNAGRHEESKRFIRDEQKMIEHQELAQRYFASIQRLLAYGVDAEVEDTSKHKPLFYAASKNAKAVAVLLMGEYDEVDPENELRIKAGGKFLHQAIKLKDNEAVDALIRLGADVNEVYLEIPFAHQTPLSVACMTMNLEAVDLLIKAGANPNFRDGTNERSALYWMVKYCYYPQDMYNDKCLEKLMKILLDAGLDLTQPVDEHDNSCIACAYTYTPGASSSFSYGMFSDLFVRVALKLGADVNQKNKHGKTALDIAVENNLQELSKWILERM